MEQAIAWVIESVTKYGVIPLFIIAAWTGARGLWVWGHQLQTMQDMWAARLNDALQDRDAWRTACLTSQGMAERAVDLAHLKKPEVGVPR